MTPFELDILLHYYGSPTDPEVFRRNPPILAETLAAFMTEELIEPQGAGGHGSYWLTDKGKAYIDAVLRVPLPVMKWIIPSADDWKGPPFPERNDIAEMIENGAPGDSQANR